MAIEGWEYGLAIGCIWTSLVFAIYYYIQYKKTEEGMRTLKDLNKGFFVMFLFFFMSRIFDNPLVDMFNPLNNVDLFDIPLGNQILYDSMAGFHADFAFVTIHTAYGDTSISNWMITNMFFLLGLAFAVKNVEKTFIQKSKGIFYIILLCAAFLSIFIALIPSTSGENIDFFQSVVNNPQDSPIGLVLSYGIAALGYLSFAIIPLIYWYLAGKTEGKVRGSAIFMGLGILCIIIDFHTVGHGSGGWERSAPTILGFFFVILANAGFKRMFPAMVDFYKTKRMCVVCKNQIKGRVFVCSGCNVFYCIRCKDAIINGENKCWNCKLVLDKSKRYKEEDIFVEEKIVEEIEIENKKHKKGKIADPNKEISPKTEAKMMEVKPRSLALFEMAETLNTGVEEKGKNV